MFALKNSTQIKTDRLTAAQVAAASRQLTNPAVRLPLPADFPPVISYHDDLPQLIKQLEKELAKYDETLDTVGEITLAYPHKHPVLFPRALNSGLKAANELHDLLAFHLKVQGGLSIDFPRADAICDTVHLGRSENQTSWHALTARQVYDVYDKAQKKPLAFLDPARQDKPHYFLIVDWHIEQGTTVAELASYLAHNGGRVLLATHTGDSGIPLVPRNDYSREDKAHLTLRQPFASAANNRAIPAIGDRLVVSAARSGVTLTRDDALENVEMVLNRHGNSLAALTHVETRRLVDALECNALTYKRLTAAPAAPSSATPGVFSGLRRVLTTALR